MCHYSQRMVFCNIRRSRTLYVRSRLACVCIISVSLPRVWMMDVSCCVRMWPHLLTYKQQLSIPSASCWVSCRSRLPGSSVNVFVHVNNVHREFLWWRERSYGAKFTSTEKRDRCVNRCRFIWLSLGSCVAQCTKKGWQRDEWWQHAFSIVLSAIGW